MARRVVVWTDRLAGLDLRFQKSPKVRLPDAAAVNAENQAKRQPLGIRLVQCGEGLLRIEWAAIIGRRRAESKQHGQSIP